LGFDPNERSILEQNISNKIMEDEYQINDFSIPPFNKYSNIAYRSIGWRMGYGEYYMHGWSDYYLSLGDEERASYRNANPEPNSWAGFYQAIEKKLSAHQAGKMLLIEERNTLSPIFQNYLDQESKLWNETKNSFYNKKIVEGEIVAFLRNGPVVNIGCKFPALIWDAVNGTPCPQGLNIGECVILQFTGAIDKRRILIFEFMSIK